MTWLSNGMALRKAAQVFGASSPSKRAWNVMSPARIVSWLIHYSRDRREEYPLQPETPEARAIPAAVSSDATRLLVRPFPLVGPTENPATLYLRLRRGSFLDFGLWRRKGLWRQILALHRIDERAVRGASDRRTIVDPRGR